MEQDVRGPAVSSYTQEPKAPALSKGQAKSERKRKGYALYNGPRLKGPRCVIMADSPRYPQQLLTARNPPKRLFVVGNPEAMTPGLAIIGARKATPYGMGCVSMFGKAAAERGICLISGGARGCDSQAHLTALAYGAPTVAVLGGGCDQIYPREHYRLFQQIVDSGGAVISEHEWDFPPLRSTFRERNRIIAGLSKALLIVEAGYPSGTFSTADEALLASREVLVVPGAITSPSSHGSNYLIRQGAVPIIDRSSFEDALFDVFGIMRQQVCQSMGLAPNSDDPIVQAVYAAPSNRDELMPVARGCCGGEDPAVWLSQHLTQLEVMGVICRYPNGRYGPVVK